MARQNENGNGIANGNANANANVENQSPLLASFFCSLVLFFAFLFSLGVVILITNFGPTPPYCQLITASLSAPNNASPATFRFSLDLMNKLPSYVYYNNLYVSVYYEFQFLNRTRIILPYHKILQETHHFPVIYVAREDSKNTLREKFFAKEMAALVRVHFRLSVQTRLIKGFKWVHVALHCEFEFGKDGIGSHFPKDCEL